MADKDVKKDTINIFSMLMKVEKDMKMLRSARFLKTLTGLLEIKNRVVGNRNRLDS